MTVLEPLARARTGSGQPMERLVCHPRLPLIAGLDSERPAVRVWEYGARRLREIGMAGADAAGYGDAPSWERMGRIPAVAWHPDEPLLVVAGEGGVVRWTPAGISGLDGLPSAAHYRGIAFSPDGRTVWASPAGGEDWDGSDALDLAAKTLDTGPAWDTGVAAHPGGGLVATLHSDQAATLVLFARVDEETAPAALHVLRRALVLDADGYETPVFSADGRRLAVRGNAYDNSVAVYEFPSLRRVLATTLGDPCPPDYPYPQDRLDRMNAWSRHNLAFGARPGVLWVGTPAGSLIGIDIDGERADEHQVSESPVTAIAGTAAGGLAVADGGGGLALLAVRDEARTGKADPGAAVAAFLGTASDIPDGVDLWSHLVLSDGTRAWVPDDLEEVTAADETDPAWLQIRAAMNNLRDRDG